MTIQAHPTDPLTSNTTTVLAGWRLFAARLVWFAHTMIIIWLLVLISIKDPSSVLYDPIIGRSYQLISSILTYQQYIDYVVFLRYVVVGSFILVGILIFWLKSKDWLALLTSIALISLPFLVYFFSTFYELNLYLPMGWGNTLSIVQGSLVILGAFSSLLLLFVFPDGHFSPRFLKRPIQGLIAIYFLGSIILSQQLSAWLNDSAWFLSLGAGAILILAGIFAQVYRYQRISSPAQRQQSKWILYSVLLNLFWGLLSILGISGFMSFTGASIFSFIELHVSVVIIALIPISMAFSILRFRLWDIDLIIRRTLVYSLLTGALSVLYFSSVALLQGILTADGRPLTAVGGPPSAVVIVVTTLAIAALANPLRRRLQSTIDRRFYRQKYDAEKALANFAAAARNETDLVQLSNGLTAAVQETLQPEKVNLWLTE